jgi:hypothetical protein
MGEKDKLISTMLCFASTISCADSTGKTGLKDGVNFAKSDLPKFGQIGVPVDGFDPIGETGL